jgi:hypothetical protein
MQKSGRSPIQSESGAARKGRASKSLVLFFVAAVIGLLQGCGGSSAPNYPPPTTLNPAPGVTLQKIQILPATSIILLAESRQLTAMGVYSDGGSVDITADVTWSASSAPSTTNYVSVDANGIATAAGVGATVISATVGPVTGLVQLSVTTNGFSSGTVAILSVLSKTTEIDVAYLPQQTLIQGAYAVQEVNLDADQFSSVLPVPVALKASIPMPVGFVPNATVASQSSSLVAVISYSSPDIQIIDASNDPTDLANNTVIATFTAPVSQQATFNGITCMICAAVVNPLNNQLMLSTAQGYYTMDLKSGKFTAVPFAPAPAASPSFSLNPAVASPYLVSASPAAGGVQILDLKTNAVTTSSNVSPAPNAVAIDLLTNYAAVADGSTNDRTLANLVDPQNPQITAVSNLGVCAGGPAFLNMVAMGVSANAVASNTVHTLFSSQTMGSCVGFEIWPNQNSTPLDPSQIFYGYGPMPATPDGNPFVNGNDPNAITTFTSVVDKKNYGVLVNADQQWIAKINFGTVISLGGIGPGTSQPLPGGTPLSTIALSAGIGGDSIVFLPTPSTSFTLSSTSINFGNVAVGTPSPQITVTLANIGAGLLVPQVAVQGANPGDFTLINNCSFSLLPQTNCAINVTFTPTGTGARSAVLSVTSSGLSPQSVPLSGTGT